MNRLLGIGAVAAVVVGFLSFKKGNMDFNFSAEENENCVMCGLSGNFVVEDLPVGPRWFCTEKHFAEYAGLPVKESGYYGFEAEDSKKLVQCKGDEHTQDKWTKQVFILVDAHGKFIPCKNMIDPNRTWIDEKGEEWPALDEYGDEGYCDDCIGYSIDSHTWALGQGHDAESFEAEESKKLPPLEKAIDTGIASGATMEGLETLLAAESEIDEKDAQTIAKQAWKKIMTHISENPYLIYDEKEYTGCGHGDGGKREHWWMDEAIDYFRNRVSTTDGYFLLENLIVEEFQDKAQNDTWMKGILRSTLTQMKKQADKMDEDDEWEAFINDVRARADEESWRQKWVAESFAAEEEPSVYYWVKTEMEKRHPMTEPDLEQLLEMLSLNVPVPVLENGMEQAEDLRDEPTYIILHLARQKAKFIEEFQADYPTVRPNCKCGAILEWDNLRKAWYCISCPFNTYKAEMDEKVMLCPHCEDAEATEICEWCKGKECKECFKEHTIDCNYCDGEGEIPRSWVSDSGDRWSPPSLDVTDWEMCEYCNEGQVCGDEDIPEFSWDAESFSADEQEACYDCGKTENPIGMKPIEVYLRKYICADCGLSRKELHRIARNKSLKEEPFKADRKVLKELGERFHRDFCSIIRCGRECSLRFRESNPIPGQYVSVNTRFNQPKLKVIRSEEYDEIYYNFSPETKKKLKDWAEKQSKELGRTVKLSWNYCEGDYRHGKDISISLPKEREKNAESFTTNTVTVNCHKCDTPMEVEAWKHNKKNPITGQRLNIRHLCAKCSPQPQGLITRGAESNELEESKKRTKMSAIRTGLAITTFGIVMWNLWTNKKQEKDIADIMDLV